MPALMAVALRSAAARYVPLDKAWNDSPEFRALCEALNRPDMHRAVVARLRCGTMAVGEAAAAQRRRREQDALFAHFLVVVGEDALRTLLEAITQNSEQPLARLPLKWRERAIAAFRQVPQRREAQIVPLRPSS